MLTKLDDLLGRITMYQLLLWVLRILTGVSLVLAAFGPLHMPLVPMIVSLVVLIGTCYVTNWGFGKIWRIPTNTESYVLTALILFLILPPATTPAIGILTGVAGILAMGSKFLVAFHRRHIFNPAAFAAGLLALPGLLSATWWVGNSLMWPLVLVAGLLVVRKIRRFSMVLTFAAVSMFIIAATGYGLKADVLTALKFALTSSPLLFLGTIMLTEPSTMPARRPQQIVFGAIVGVLYATAFSAGKLVIYPETALLLGNIYAYAVNQRYRLRLTLARVEPVSEKVVNYVFTPDRRPEFLPGQYMEWTLPGVPYNSRGNRRTFSIASSPTEPEVMMGVKFYQPSSKLKQVLHALQPGTDIYAGHVAGDFVLPADASEKLLFIAGGIGITPFRSMLKYLVDTGQERDIVLIYAVADPSEVAYEDVLQAAKDHGVTVIRLLTSEKAPKGWQGTTGRLTADCIRTQVPDYSGRTAYVSGPNAMVLGLKKTLHDMGIERIRTDYFTGY